MSHTHLITDSVLGASSSFFGLVVKFPLNGGNKIGFGWFKGEEETALEGTWSGSEN